MSFDLVEEIRRYDAADHGKPYSPRTPDAAAVLLDCEHDPSSLSAATANGVLNRIFDAVVEDPDNITRPEHLDSVRFLINQANSVPTPSLDKLLELLTAGLATEAENAQSDLDQDRNDTLQDHRLRLEVFAFHLQWLLNAVDERYRAADRQGPVRQGKKKKDSSTWDPTPRIIPALKAMSDLLHRVKLSKIFVTTADRDTFIKLITTPVYFLLEHEKRVKQDRNFRQHTYKVLCAAVKEHGHGYSAQTIIYQRLTNYKHLFEPMAEFVHILANEYAYPQLAEDVLRDLSSREYGSAETEGPRSIGEFISKLADLNPRLVIKQFPLLKTLLDAEPYPLRNAIISVCQNLIAMLHRDLVNCPGGEDDAGADAIRTNILDYLDLLDARFMDVSHYCRCRTISEYTKMLEIEHFDFSARRQIASELACRSLEDKSSQVRINAIKMLTRLIETHPFRRLYQAQLSLSAYQDRLQEINEEIERVRPTNQDVEGMVGLVDQPTEMSPAKPSAENIERAEKNAEALAACKQVRRLLFDAIAFIEVMDNASKSAMQLLGAKSKSEVIATMNFFRKAYAHGMESAHVGLRRMLRLIWTKGASDEGKNVPDHLVECYQEFFFIPPPGYSPDQAAGWIARNMVSLTYDSSQADLTSLEKLLSTMLSDGKIDPLVIDKLWDMYRVPVDISRKQRRGVINVLGMLTLADPDIVVKEMETCLEIGLGRQGVKDLVLARYTCIALMRMNANAKRGTKAPALTRLDNSHMVLQRLEQMVLRDSTSSDWYGMAEQALGTIYALSNHPDVLCTEIIRKKTKAVFSRPDPDAMDVDVVEPDNSTLGLSQLLFIVGHVAIKQIVHLELCEQDYKRRKAAKAEARKDEQDEMDLIAGNEDEFSDGVQAVREQELLFKQSSILSQFGPLVREICSNPGQWANKDLQAHAALCMAKLMCVSSLYCSDNLDLMIKILGRSKDATTRSNLVIAFADMLACFNHLLDRETTKMFDRLSDRSLSVRRTCLLTLTFLVLAGQIKVKGHLGKMAKCVEAEDEWTREMSRMFFSELSGKDNAVYNNFLDMISTLSADESLSEDQFKKIAKFVAAFVEGDKQTKQLAARLAFKLQRAGSEKEWGYYAHVLGLLPHKDEEIVKVVAEGYRTVESREVASQVPASQEALAVEAAA